MFRYIHDQSRFRARVIFATDQELHRPWDFDSCFGLVQMKKRQWFIKFCRCDCIYTFQRINLFFFKLYQAFKFNQMIHTIFEFADKTVMFEWVFWIYLVEVVERTVVFNAKNMQYFDSIVVQMLGEVAYFLLHIVEKILITFYFN